jgi:hypothetical protein
MCQKGEQSDQQRQAEFRAAQPNQPAEDADASTNRKGGSGACRGGTALYPIVHDERLKEVRRRRKCSLGRTAVRFSVNSLQR